MKKKPPAEAFVHHDFAFTSDADLSARIAAFKAEHEAARGEILAMHERRSLGAAKVRVTFRVRR